MKEELQRILTKAGIPFKQPKNDTGLTDEALLKLNEQLSKTNFFELIDQKENDKMKINVYLDDLRDCPTGFVLAETMEELLHLFETHEVGILSLDHDLGEDQNGNLLPTGYDFVKHFCEYGLSCEKIYLHTDNTVGRENMEAVLNASKKRGFISKDIAVYPYPFVPNKYSGN